MIKNLRTLSLLLCVAALQGSESDKKRGEEPVKQKQTEQKTEKYAVAISDTDVVDRHTDNSDNQLLVLFTQGVLTAERLYYPTRDGYVTQIKFDSRPVNNTTLEQCDEVFRKLQQLYNTQQQTKLATASSSSSDEKSQ